MGIYLDWAATSIPDYEVVKNSYEKGLEIFGNPSSIHNKGIEARNLLEDSRERASRSLGVSSKNIFFTSGGTESNNIALLSLVRKKIKGNIISTNMEHSSVYEPLKIAQAMGFNIIRIDPDKNGITDPEKIAEALSEETMMVSVMHVNNETGAIQPIEEIGKIIKQFSKKKGNGILFHCDGVQAAGKIRLDIENSGIDFYSASSHKISGPRGCGLLYCRKKILSFYSGGGQESGIRPGTENTPAIYGFSLALEKYGDKIDENKIHASALCSRLIEGLTSISGCSIIPRERKLHDLRFSPYIISFSIAKVPAEVLTRVLSGRGYYISAGAACS
ncbi:MAG: cysteine desulfurase family protein, partial [Spirochaetia bacterium]|nr:cysteine desulfurase family protein [Spirochaetia bacterium]